MGPTDVVVDPHNLPVINRVLGDHLCHLEGPISEGRISQRLHARMLILPVFARPTFGHPQEHFQPSVCPHGPTSCLLQN